MSRIVNRDRADRVAEAELGIAVRDPVPGRVYAFDSLAIGERLRSGRDQQHVLRALHDDPGEPNRVAYPANAGHSSGASGVAAHQRGVVLDLAVLVHDGSSAGVEQRVVLQFDGGSLHGVERTPALVEDRPAGLGGKAQALVVGLLVADAAARAAVDYEADSSSSSRGMCSATS